jgi:hypothetical protein
VGTTIIYGRASTYGGPFAHISGLKRGDRITVTVQDEPNTATYRVVDIRRAGQKIPAIGTGGSRLTLVTAAESWLVPSGVVYVDADIVGTPLSVGAPAVSPERLPRDELPLGADTSGVGWAILWVVLLGLALGGTMWTRQHKGRAQAWIIFGGPVVLICFVLVNHLSQLLPNLM